MHLQHALASGARYALASNTCVHHLLLHSDAHQWRYPTMVLSEVYSGLGVTQACLRAASVLGASDWAHLVKGAR